MTRDVTPTTGIRGQSVVSASGAAKNISTALGGARGVVGAATAVAGTAITVTTISQDFFGKDGFDAKVILEPTTMAITGGGTLLALAGSRQAKAGITIGENMSTYVQAGGAALVLAGVGGIVARPLCGLVGWDPVLPKVDPKADPTYSVTPFATGTIDDPLELAGNAIAVGKVATKDGGSARPSVHLDPATFVDEGTERNVAIGKARQRTQEDFAGDKYRAHAVVETSDGHFWTARLTGALDQIDIDGPSYTDGNSYSSSIEPTLYSRQEAVVAIVGSGGYIKMGVDDEQAGTPTSFTDIPYFPPRIPAAKPNTTQKAADQ